MILAHLDTMYRFYGERTGVRVARKHLTWYCRNLDNAESFRQEAIRTDSSVKQMQLTINFFDRYVNKEQTAAFNV
jgi:tRNA-dihydrouridine synthase B